MILLRMSEQTSHSRQHKNTSTCHLLLGCRLTSKVGHWTNQGRLVGKSAASSVPCRRILAKMQVQHSGHARQATTRKQCKVPPKRRMRGSGNGPGAEKQRHGLAAARSCFPFPSRCSSASRRRPLSARKWSDWYHNTVSTLLAFFCVFFFHACTAYYM